MCRGRVEMLNSITLNSVRLTLDVDSGRRGIDELQCLIV